MPRSPGRARHGLRGDRTLMRIHVGEADEYRGRSLYRSIVEHLRGAGLAGATVSRCIMGFGATGPVHSFQSDITSLDLPVVIECVESEERILAVLPALDEMIGGGLITLERADVIVYRGAAGAAGAAEGGMN